MICPPIQGICAAPMHSNKCSIAILLVRAEWKKVKMGRNGHPALGMGGGGGGGGVGALIQSASVQQDAAPKLVQSGYM